MEGRCLVDPAVVVPVAADHLDEPDSALDQPPGDQAVAGERRLVRVHAVQRQRGPALPSEIQQLGSAGLHPKRHFVGRDPRGDLGVAGLGQAFLVQFIDQVDEPLLLRRVTPGGSVTLRIGSPTGRSGTPW